MRPAPTLHRRSRRPPGTCAASIVAAGGDHAVGHAQRLEDFQAARLDPFAARTAERLRGLIDQHEADMPARQVDGFMSRPEPDVTLMAEMSMPLERALLPRRASARDKRVREAEVTELGREMADAADRMREQLVGELMADWANAERRDLARLMKRLAGDMSDWLLHRHADDVDDDGDAE